MQTRRQFVRQVGAGLAGLGVFSGTRRILGQLPGDRPSRTEGVRVINPQARVPLSFIIDDSTCLVNLAYFAIPQFAQVFPDRYTQNWKRLPREIPDDFVRKFGEWCGERDIKGKYSIVPYPACVGWLDRELPGWSRKELADSLDLVRTLMLPNWDIHPEMVTHTWIINTKTGRPYEEKSERFMENWRWTDGKSVDELADYLSYALRILKNVGLPCEGITTPGGFGNRVLPELAQATLQSCRDVFQAEIPHYFRHLFTDDQSVAPRVEYASGLDTDDPQCVVSIIGCTGDWFGGWDGLEAGSVDQFITADLASGRLVEVIDKGEPACLVCHWPGIYFNGEEIGFNIFKEIVSRLNQKYDNLIWMKNSEIARYWAAKELTLIEINGDGVHFHAPFECPGFTVEVDRPRVQQDLSVDHAQSQVRLHRTGSTTALKPATWTESQKGVTVCFDLPKGKSVLRV
jgi:hypothetical protein